MTEQELAEIEKRCNAATPGPWTAKRIGHFTDDTTWELDDSTDVPLPIEWILDAPPTKENMTFAAASRADVSALVAEVRRIAEHLDGLPRD
jgi:hypothetical protein